MTASVVLSAVKISLFPSSSESVRPSGVSPPVMRMRMFFSFVRKAENRTLAHGTRVDIIPGKGKSKTRIPYGILPLRGRWLTKEPLDRPDAGSRIFRDTAIFATEC